MEHASALSAWESFYVIVGSSGGALIGLQFVVITLIADRRQLARSGTLNAFGTPTVAHLTGALVLSAVMSAPWPSIVTLSLAIATCGVVGLGYGVVVIRRVRRQSDYEAVWEDWFWFAALPFLAYAVLTGVALWLPARPAMGLFVVAATALALLLVGIHNAWDSIVHIVVTTADQERAGE